MREPRLRVLAGREGSQKSLLKDLGQIVTEQSAESIVVLICYDDGDHGILASHMDRAQLVYMLEEAKHDALCGYGEDEPDFEPETPEAS